MILKPKILLVDDQVENLIVLKETLRHLNVEFIWALSGEEALKQVLKHDFALLLIDVQMPELDGYETVELLRQSEEHKHLPVIFISAIYAENVYQIKGLESGAFDFITKPFVPEILIGKVRNFLELYAYKAALVAKNAELTQLNQQLEEERALLAQRVEERTTDLSQANAELSRVARFRSEFLANMSHELRTPLNGILGYAQILNRDKSLTEKQRQAIDAIQRSGDHLLTLINDILDLSKIEADKLELIPNEFHLPDFLKDIVDIFSIRCQQKEIGFKYEQIPPPGLMHTVDNPGFPTLIYADEKRLRQIFLNLLSNAVKFTQKGQVSFKVVTQKNQIHFEVKDSGLGIAPENIAKIFLPFQQVDKRMSQIEGTGLGLPITKKLVTMMGGELQVNSTLDMGSTFWFEIPVEVINYQFEPVSTTQSRPTQIVGYKNRKNSPATAEKIKILIVDNAEVNRAVLIDLLEPLGFEVQEAENGQVALKQTRQFQPDIIIMDVKMPVMDGLECIRRIRQELGMTEILIITLSASVFSHNQQESFQAGSNAFLGKPLQAEQLFQLLAQQGPLEWIYESELNK